MILMKLRLDFLFTDLTGLRIHFFFFHEQEFLSFKSSVVILDMETILTTTPKNIA